MTYARLVTVLVDRPEYCVCGSIRDAEACELRLARGEPVGDRYPKDPFSVKAHLDPDFPGVKLPSIIGNTRGLLMLSRAAVELFEKGLDLRDHEAFPFTLVNHKGRVHSKDYVFLNPLGAFDVAHGRAELLRYPSGGVYGCRRWVFASSKLRDLPDLFRAREHPRDCFASERLVALVREHGLTNFEFDDVEIA